MLVIEKNIDKPNLIHLKEIIFLLVIKFYCNFIIKFF